MNNVCYNHICYADDSILLAPSPIALQELIVICEEYGYEYEMIYNTKKTVCMKFLPKRLKHLDDPLVYLYNNPLKWVTEQKYLGVIISNDKSDNSDIYRQIRSTYTQGNTLVSRFKHCSREVKCHLFKTYCYNLYNCQLWCTNTAGVMNRMKVAYNNVFRALMNVKRGDSISHVYVCENILGFDALLRKSTFSFYKRSLASSNALVHNIVSSTYFNYASKIYSVWKLRLYAL